VAQNAVCEVGLSAGRRVGHFDDPAALPGGSVFREYPPAINRPEFYFAGVTLAWQVMFLVIGSDPVRYRVAMLPAMLEKAGFALAVPILYAAERVTVVWLGFAAMDATWLVLFVVAYLRTPKEPPLDGKA
jgi:hypothetical protein